MMNLGLMDGAFLGLVGERDPYFSNVSLLLHGNGSNGSTLIVDSSPSPKTVTAVGNAQISTAQSRFGGGSIAFDGSGDRLSLNSNTSFNLGTGDFTIEAFVYETQRRQYATLIELGPHLQSTGIVALTNGGNNLTGNVGTYSNIFYGVLPSASLNAWNFVAYQRKNGVLTIFVNETASTSVSLANNLTTSGSSVTIGSIASGSSLYDFNGYIDELRVTKGVARYEVGTGVNAGKIVHAGTNILALPTAPFPDA